MSESSDSLRDRVKLRPVEYPADEAFMQLLYFQSREDLAEIVEDEEQLRQILLLQYRGQRHTYQQQFPDADDDIVMFDDEPVGRLLIDRNQQRLFGVDILMLPEKRSLGIGAELLRRLFDECSCLGIPFEFSVARGNPAIRLYERLGCQQTGENETHLLMRWDNSSK